MRSPAAKDTDSWPWLIRSTVISPRYPESMSPGPLTTPTPCLRACPLLGSTRPAYPGGIATAMPVGMAARSPGCNRTGTALVRSQPASPGWACEGAGASGWRRRKLICMGNRRGASTGGQHHGDDVINSTARRRGRHAAVTPRPVPVSLPPPPAPRKRSSEDTVRLPGMEVLGFYDEPYVVRVAPPPRRIPRPVVTTAPPMTPATDATSRVASLWETTQIEESALEWWRPQVVAR